jgi:hypothetical protein
MVDGLRLLAVTRGFLDTLLGSSLLTTSSVDIGERAILDGYERPPAVDLIP